MREILFKAKRVDNGEWVVGQYVNTCYPGNDKETGHFIVVYPNEYHEIYTSTICQCTGIKDKNGKMIWENDIMVGHLDDMFPENATYVRVMWHNNGFYTRQIDRDDYDPFDELDQNYFEVCGNVFDNPELLQEVK